MAVNRIKGITIEIGGDTSKLQDALKKTNSEIKTTQTNLKDINKLLKLDPGNVTLLEQKYKALGTQIGSTKDKLDTLKDAQKQMSDAGKVNTDEYDALQREIADTEQGLKELEKEYRNFGSVQAQQVAAAGQKMKDFGDKVTSVGTGLTTGLTVPLAAIGTAGAASFAEVDKTMQLTNQTMGNTEQQAQLLNQAMKDAASNSTYGMKDAATATLNFARAGLDAEQAASALGPAMNLAAGEGGNLDTVSAGLVATINGFHGSFEEAGQYADVFAAACNNSALDVDSLSTSMSIAAPVFSAAGYSVNDAALYMGVMANNGIEADKAANSLKTGLARLVSPAKEGAEMMDQLGISVTNADGTMKSSVQIQKELHDAFSNLSESEQIAAASAIFGKNQMAPWLALINTAPNEVSALSIELDGASLSTDSFNEQLKKSGTTYDDMKARLENLGISGEAVDAMFKTCEGDAGLFAEGLLEAADTGVGLKDVADALGISMEELQAAMDGTKGTTDEMAEAMMTGFGGSIEKLKSSIDVLVTSIGEALAPTIQKVTEFIQGLVDKFNSLSPAQQETIVKVGLVVAAIGPLLVAVGKVASGIGSILKLIPLLKTALTAVTSPMGLVVLAIAGLVAAFVTLWNTSDSFRNFWKGVWESIKNFASGAVDGIKSMAQGLSTTLSNMKTNVSNVFSGMWNFISGVVSKLKGIFNFQWHLPRIALPHFSISGHFSLNPPSIPHISVSWYKKAMEGGMILNSPTIFGAMGGQLLGGGEAGSEAVVGTDSLQRMIQEAVASQTDSMMNGIVRGMSGMNLNAYIGSDSLGRAIIKAERSNAIIAGR